MASNNDFWTANTSTLTTDFNVVPYYDDFDSSKNYHKILFKPGYAVQARELTQIQSILQDQIQKFGQHIFKEGSAVLGGKFTIDQKVPYVKVLDYDSANVAVPNITAFKDQLVTGNTTGLQAYVSLTLDGVQTSENTKTLYVTYKNSNPTSNTTAFAAGEILYSNIGTLVTASSNTTGLGSVFTINEGVRYAKEHFIQHDKQSVVIGRYNVLPTCKVGFNISEDIYNFSQDSTLLDPALEASNYSAPGADRFKLSATMEVHPITDDVGPPNFVSLFDIRAGEVQELNEKSTYNVIADEIAKRTSDESGDYYVSGLGVQIMENLNTANNGGYLYAADGGDANNLTVVVEPGLAYVKGYAVETLVSKYTTIPKSTAYNNVSSQIISSRVGSYVTVNCAVGTWNTNFGQKLNLYDTFQRRVSTGVGSAGAPTGNTIGTAHVKSLTYGDGLLGSSTADLYLHLFDIQMLGSNTFSNVKSVFAESTSNVVADIVTDGSGNAKLNDVFTPLIYYVGNKSIKSIRDTAGTVQTSFTFRKTSNLTSISSSGGFTLSTSGSEYFPYTTGAYLTDADKKDLILTINESFTISLPNTLSAVVSNNTLVGTGTHFTYFNVGDKIQISGNTKNYIVASVANNTYLTTTDKLPTTVAGNTLSRVYVAGDMVDLRSFSSTTGYERSVYCTSSQSLTFDLAESLGATRSGTITYSVARTTAKETAKTLKTDRYVKINVASANTTTGPFNLGISDVFRVSKIIKKSGSFSANTSDGTDITQYFNLDSGQRDSFYKHCAIKPSITLANTDYLLVQLDYFTPDFSSGVGYFSVDSYPVNDTSPISGEIETAQIPIYVSDTGIPFDLRNCLDFRPVYVNTAADATTPATATINPTAATTLNYDAAGLRLPAESEQITFDYSYYLPRIDVVTINRNGGIEVISGTPGSSPRTPLVTNDTMALARVLIPPYPSLSLNYGRLLRRTDLSCVVSKTSNLRYTMRDIGVLKSRVDQLERYVSLNLLEKSTLDLKVLDENNLDRFKNGIFVDSFSDNSLSAFTSKDHHISYDSVEKSIRPLFEMEALGYNYDPTLSTNVVRTGDYVTLPYTETTMIVQPWATTNRNIETTVFKFVGKVYLNPDKDFWIQVKTLADAVIVYSNEEIPKYTPYSVSYGSWQITAGGQWQRVSYDWWNWGSWNAMSSALTSLGSGAEIQYYYESETPDNWSGWTYGGGYLGTGYHYYDSVETILGKSVTSTLGAYAGKEGQGWAGGISPSDLYAVTTQSRSVHETFQELVTEYSAHGQRLVDVTQIADIRPQTIAFHGTSLKANTRHYVFFDGIRMSDYVTPANNDPVLIGTNGLKPTHADPKNYEDPPANRSYSYVAKGAEGSTLLSDNYGNAYGLLRLPSDGTRTFRTGTKELIITDSYTNDEDATSVAKGTFTAQGLLQTKQDEILATKVVKTSYKDTTQQQNSVLIYDRVSCLAYSFIPKAPPSIEGIYLTSFEVFFANKDPQLGVWFEIRAMDNAGGITRTQIPGSEVWLRSDQVNVSDNAQSNTYVTFPTPVFLRNNIEYALVIHTENINPNYYIWVAKTGENDVYNGRQYNDRSLTGSLYTTNNNLDWDIVPKTDLKIRFLRAKFDTSVTGSAVFGNEYSERLSANVSNVSSAFTAFGEVVNGLDRIKLSAPTITPSATDLIIGNTSNINAAVLSVTSSEYKMNSFGYIVGEPATLRRANGLSVGTATIASKNTATGMVYDYIPSKFGNTMELRSSNGKFFAGDVMRGLTSNNTLVIDSVDDFVYSTIQFEPSFMNFANTNLIFQMQTVANTGSVGSYELITPSVITDFYDEKRVYSRTNEIANLSGQYSNKFRGTFSTNSDYISPVIDTSRSYCVYVHNIINSNSANELLPAGGKFTNQYLSQVITLAEGQDAEDLHVILSAYRPPSSNSNFFVYARYSNAEDPENITARSWIKLDYYSDTVYSSLSNRNDFKDFSFDLPASVLTGTIGTVTGVAQYSTTSGGTFTGFRQFQLKIALQSDNSAIFPRIKQLRAIALQK